jgi:hypothetical protein
MTYPSALLCHTANLETGETTTTNAWGTVATPIYTSISCRFGQAKGSYPYSESGDRIIKSPVCIVPATTTVSEGKLLAGLTAPFTKTYRVTQVNPAMLAKTVSHLVLELEAVE